MSLPITYICLCQTYVFAKHIRLCQTHTSLPNTYVFAKHVCLCQTRTSLPNMYVFAKHVRLSRLCAKSFLLSQKRTSLYWKYFKNVLTYVLILLQKKTLAISPTLPYGKRTVSKILPRLLKGFSEALPKFQKGFSEVLLRCSWHTTTTIIKMAETHGWTEFLK